MQAFSVVVTTDRALKEELMAPHFGQEMVREAPVLVTFCADFHRMRHWLAAREAPDQFDNPMSFLIGAIDAILVAQSAALAAEGEGLGICFLGTTLASCRDIARILKLPLSVVPVAGFVLGHPAESPARRDRLRLTGLVHRETYRDYAAADIDEIYAAREAAGWSRHLADPELRAKIEVSGVKNLAQVYTTVKYTRESHERYSREVLRCLVEQDFMK
jgi:hypothetical protein